MEQSPSSMPSSPSSPVPEKRTCGPSGVTCAFCRKLELLEEKRFGACGKCRMASYCSKECQTRDWSEGAHKIACARANGAQISDEEKRILYETERAKGTHFVDDDDHREAIDAPGIANLADDPLFTTVCACMNEVERHYINATKNETCSRLGCFKPLRPGCYSFEFRTSECKNPIMVPRRANRRRQGGLVALPRTHVYQQMFCSDSCARKARAHEAFCCI